MPRNKGAIGHQRGRYLEVKAKHPEILNLLSVMEANSSRFIAMEDFPTSLNYVKFASAIRFFMPQMITKMNCILSDEFQMHLA